MENNQPTTNLLDPTALTLSRAIRSAEGGNYTALGDNGTAAGAYQWSNQPNGKPEKLSAGQIPSNFRKAASQYGLDPNDFSETNQDHVAYEQIKAQLDAGHSQSEIASWWNSGRYDSANNIGYNSAINSHYDTPAYMEKVKKAYEKEAQSFTTSVGTGPDTSFVNPNQKPATSNFVTPPPAPTISPTEDVPKQGFFSSLLQGAQDVGKSIASPILGVASLPFQAGLAGYNAITGQHIEDPTQQGGLPVAGLGNTPVTPLDLEKKAGDIAQVGGMALPGTGAIGTTLMGGLMGAGGAMSKGEDLPSVLGSGALGAGTGLALGGAARLGGEFLKSIGGKISGAGFLDAMSGLRDAYSKVLNLPAGERLFENRTGKDLAQVLIDHSAPLGKYENGTLNTMGAIEKLQPELDILNEQANKLLAGEGVVGNISMEDIYKSVVNRINNTKMPASQAKSMIKEAQQYLADETEKYGVDVTPQVADKIKQGFQNAVFKKATNIKDKLSNDVQYLISDEFKNATEKAVAGTDAGDVLGKLNAQRSDLIDAIKRLTNADGVRLVRGGRLGNMIGGLIGTGVGATTGNPFMALGGDYFGTKAAEFLNNPATRIGWANLKKEMIEKTPGMITGGLKKGAPLAGKALSATGKVLSRSARPAGLLGELLMLR